MTSQTFIDLSRWQFATTAASHMTFPALSVGLAIFLVICYGAYYRTGNPLYLQMFRFCLRVELPTTAANGGVTIPDVRLPANTRLSGCVPSAWPGLPGWRPGPLPAGGQPRYRLAGTLGLRPPSPSTAGKPGRMLRFVRQN